MPSKLRLVKEKGALVVPVTDSEVPEDVEVLNATPRPAWRDDDPQLRHLEPCNGLLYFRIGEGEQVFRSVMSHLGGAQGDVPATFMTINAYHDTCRIVQKAHPSVRIACIADDTMMAGEAAELYRSYKTKITTQAQRNTLRENTAKAGCYSPEGDMSDAPAWVPGSSHHKDDEGNLTGELSGLKIAGAYHGDADWVEAQIDATINGTPVPGGGRRGGRLANLDKVDEHSDNENIKNVLSHCQRVTRNCAAVQPLYYLRQVRPSLTRRAAVAADVRIASTLEHIAHAEMCHDVVLDNLQCDSEDDAARIRAALGSHGAVHSEVLIHGLGGPHPGGGGGRRRLAWGCGADGRAPAGGEEVGREETGRSGEERAGGGGRTGGEEGDEVDDGGRACSGGAAGRRHRGAGRRAHVAGGGQGRGHGEGTREGGGAGEEERGTQEGEEGRGGEEGQAAAAEKGGVAAGARAHGGGDGESGHGLGGQEEGVAGSAGTGAARGERQGGGGTEAARACNTACRRRTATYIAGGA